MRLRGRSVAASPALALKVLEGGVMGLAQDAVWWVWLGVHTWTVLGVRPRLMWGAVWQPCALLSAVVVGLWRGHCGSGGWCGGAHTTAAAVAMHEHTLLHTSHPVAP